MTALNIDTQKRAMKKEEKDTHTHIHINTSTHRHIDTSTHTRIRAYNKFASTDKSMTQATTVPGWFGLASVPPRVQAARLDDRLIVIAMPPVGGFRPWTVQRRMNLCASECVGRGHARR
jgi:hypothetical protein